MKEYIEREAFIEAKRKQYCADCDRRKGMKNGKMRFCYEIGEAPCRACYVDDLLTDVEDAPAADVVAVRHGLNNNTEYADCDQFVCSECGIELQGWCRVERDCDDGEEYYSDYIFRFCPHCGAKIDGGVNRIEIDTVKNGGVNDGKA